MIYKDLMIVGAAIPRRCPPPRATFTPTTYAPENSAGRFTPFHISANSVTKPGRRRPGSQRRGQQLGRHDLDANAASFMSRPVRRRADFYGADRVGDDLFANCLIALNADTGERIWHFQVGAP